MKIDKLIKLDGIKGQLELLDFKVVTDDDSGDTYIVGADVWAKKDFLESLKNDLNNAIKDVKMKYVAEINDQIKDELTKLIGDRDSD